MKNDSNPWVDVMIGQLLICRWANVIALKICDPRAWEMTDAVIAESIPRHEPRLNPFEFHGLRRSSTLPLSVATANRPGAV